MLTSNIMQLLCRTCLQMHKEKYDIFKHSENNKLIVDIIMECIPIKIHKNDDFPVHICNSCLEKIRISWDFRLSAIQSDVKLHNFYEAKTRSENSEESDCNDDNLEVIKPEDTLVMKPEKADSLEHSNDPLDLQNIDVKCEDIPVCKNTNELTLNNDDSLNDSTIESNRHSHDSESSGDSTENSIKRINKNKPLSATKKRKYTKITLPKNRQLHLNKQKTQLNGENTSLQKKRKYTRKSNISTDVNRQQAALLDNPDYKRIMAMQLTMREKNRQLVYCPDCKKSYKFQYFVSTHSHLHTGNLLFKCEKCDRRFPNSSLLKQHFRQHGDTKNYTCDVCERAFFHLQHLKYHKLQIHSNERPHKCDICSKGFKLSFLLQKHIKIHKNERDHVCEVCGKAFVDLGGLSNHQRSHSSEKNFNCKVCDKKFKQKWSLQLHERKHTGEKPYSCDQCGRGFSNNALVKRHILIHTGEKPFACEICGQKFRQKACIPRHMRIHTGETPYPCELCPSKFKYSHHLLKHLKNNHDKGEAAN